MEQERWRQIEELYHSALEHAEVERAGFLRGACPHEDMRREVESLLACDRQEASALDAPAWKRHVTVGDRIGPYQILSRIGAGGMGEVWKAADTRLDRTVAIKVSTQPFSGRFQREERALAALNHPNICTLYDVGTDCLVMEYIEGAPVKGPMGVERALKIGAEIAGALDAAHRHGVIHRDLKPANILLTKAGVKLLDFGLAKMSRAAGSDQTVTVEGTVAGTLQYMSPEQLEGKEADARSDIFSFGCVLSELLTGRPARDVASGVPAIPIQPPALERVLNKCLAKDPEERWQSARDLRDELLWLASEAPAPKAAIRHGWIAWIVAAAVLGAIAIFALLRWQSPAVTAQLHRFPLLLPGGVESFRISPNGDELLYLTESPTPEARLFDLASGISRPLAGLNDLRDFFWSPDSHSIGFRVGDVFRKLDISTGLISTIASAASVNYFAAWTSAGDLLYYVPGVGITRMPPDTGKPSVVTRLVPPARFQLGIDPLPGDQRFLYFAAFGARAEGETRVATLDGRSDTLLMRSDTSAVYAAPGYVLYLRGDSLVAQPFDPKRAAFQGPGRKILDHVAREGTLPWDFYPMLSVSQTGILVYRPGTRYPQSRLTWFDRSGRAIGTLGEPQDYTNPALSPDETRLAVSISDPLTSNRDLWIFDLARGGSTRFTHGEGDDTNPVWSPDGSEIAYGSVRDGLRSLYLKKTAVALAEERLLQSETFCVTEDWSADGSLLSYNVQPPGESNIWLLAMNGTDRTPSAFHATRFIEQQSTFSPDGKFLAYRSNDSGRFEVVVQSLKPGGGRWQVSTHGGSEPRWRRDGKELFYIEGNLLMAVDVAIRGDTLSAGVPHRLFDVPPSGQHRNRLVVTPEQQQAQVPVVVINWPRLLDTK
jgi:predicted Ser/Thr protein kinase